jgi:hypothetical protein
LAHPRNRSFRFYLPKFARERRIAIQLFRVLPSSNIMGAKDKLDRSSRWEKKGACQWNHSGQPSGRLAVPAEHQYLSDALQFLIANPRLKFKLSHSKISTLQIANRERMAILQSQNRATSRTRTGQLPAAFGGERSHA